MKAWPKAFMGKLFQVEKGKIGIMAATPGNYPLVTTGEAFLSHIEPHFSGDAVCIPLISATGHGHASLKRLHHIKGEFAAGSILCACINQSPDRVLARFAYYYLSACKDSVLIPLMQGTANMSMKVQDIAGVEIPVPPLEEQQAIVARLDSLAEKTQQLEAHLDAVDQDSLRLLVTMATRSDLSADQRLALRWREVTLASIAKVALDPVTVNPTQSYPNIGIYSYARGLFEKPPIDGIATSAKTLYRIKAGQFIYSRLFAFEGAYALIDASFDGNYVSNEFPTFDVDPEIATAKFVMSLFLTEQDWHSLRAASKGVGDRRLRIQPQDILTRKIWLPPPEELARIDELYDRHFALKAKHTAIRAANAALLPATLERIFQQAH
ncbi:MAG: restriction endonuclease subunit S [Betaproteobacteria bacterium]|jgi:type I restriction enzyme S subunit|nr:restriction endonuclease subunit S [Betaproteobacteria bacterium]